MRRLLALPWLLQCTTASIFCLIHTATPSHSTRAQTILETWAKRCDDFIFFTDSPMASDIPHIYWRELHSRDHSWEKIRRIFSHVVEGMDEEYDWYLRADDDAYVIVENLRDFLSKYSSKEAHYFGYKWNFFVPHGYADGGVYVLSRPAVEVFNRIMKNPALCPEHHRAEEDQEMGRCLAAAGIYPEDTRDENGSDRFHHFHPTEQLLMYRDPFARRSAYYPPLQVLLEGAFKGMQKYEMGTSLFAQQKMTQSVIRESSNVVVLYLRSGADNFSPEMVGFHHLSPHEMRIFDYVLYKLKRRVPSSLSEHLDDQQL